MDINKFRIIKKKKTVHDIELEIKRIIIYEHRPRKTFLFARWNKNDQIAFTRYIKRWCIVDISIKTFKYK